MANSASWQQIFDTYSIHNHCFEQKPYIITAEQIKKACQHFTKTTQKEIFLLFFEKRELEYHIWQYGFNKADDYNSIELIKSKRYIITQNKL